MKIEGEFKLDSIRDHLTGNTLIIASELNDQLPDPSIGTKEVIDIAFKVVAEAGKGGASMPVIHVERRFQNFTEPDRRRGMWIVGNVVVKMGSDRYASNVVTENGAMEKVYINDKP